MKVYWNHAGGEGTYYSRCCGCYCVTHSQCYCHVGGFPPTRWWRCGSRVAEAAGKATGNTACLAPLHLLDHGTCGSIFRLHGIQTLHYGCQHCCRRGSVFLGGGWCWRACGGVILPATLWKRGGCPGNPPGRLPFWWHTCNNVNRAADTMLICYTQALLYDYNHFLCGMSHIRHSCWVPAPTAAAPASTCH